MPHIRNIILFSAITILYSFSAYKAYAQYPGMAAFRAQQSQQFITQQMRVMMQMNLNRNWRKNVGKGDEYAVILKDGDSIPIKSYMYLDTVLHKNFLIFVNKKFPKSDSVHRFQKIYPDQTVNISAMVTDGQGFEEERYGLPTDSGWSIKVITGAIKIYAKSGYYLKAVSISTFGSPKLDFASDEIIGIQLNDGPIIKLSKDNVLKIVAGDSKATEYVEKKGLYEAVRKYNHDAGKVTKK